MEKVKPSIKIKTKQESYKKIKRETAIKNKRTFLSPKQKRRKGFKCASKDFIFVRTKINNAAKWYLIFIHFYDGVWRFWI